MESFLISERAFTEGTTGIWRLPLHSTWLSVRGCAHWPPSSQMSSNGAGTVRRVPLLSSARVPDDSCVTSVWRVEGGDCPRTLMSTFVMLPIGHFQADCQVPLSHVVLELELHNG